jgi:hypothetical protein
MSYIFTFLIIFILLWSFGFGANLAFSLFDTHKDMMDMSQEEAMTQTGEYSVSRNQVLLEIATGTW